MSPSNPTPRQVKATGAKQLAMGSLKPGQTSRGSANTPPSKVPIKMDENMPISIKPLPPTNSSSCRWRGM